jgi:hypothetical protein
MSKDERFKTIFNQLRDILKANENVMKVTTDTEENYYLDTYKINPKNKQAIFFGAVKINKNYVSYHLMPVYIYPELLEDISTDLKKSMQGKSCFNFKEINEDLIGELKNLTEMGLHKYKENNLLR